MTKKKLKASARKKATAVKAVRKTKRIASASKGALKNTAVKRNPRRAKLQHIVWNSMEAEELNPLLFRRFVVGHNVMVARFLLKKGCVVPVHSHSNEQISCVLEGSLEFGIDGKQVVVSAGEILAIPPNMPHGAVALADTVAIDIFDPPRADWINKTDAYLR